MTDHINLVKLCVGAEAVEDLLAWQNARFGSGNPVHVTRMWPKRAEEILAGGSLYWVFKGAVLARQRIVALEKRVGADGIARCAIVMDHEVQRTEPMPKRPFQGWRYMAPADAPRDLPKGRDREDPLPREMLQALADMGLR